MSGWDFQINRSGVTTAAGTASWRLRAADTSGASASDIVGGLPQTGTVNFASGDVQKLVHIDVAPNTTPGQGTRGVIFEITAVTPSGSVIDTATTTGFIEEDDSAGGGGGTADKDWGTQSSVPRFQASKATPFIEFDHAFYDGYGGKTIEIFVGGTDANNGFLVRYDRSSNTAQGFAITNGTRANQTSNMSLSQDNRGDSSRGLRVAVGSDNLSVVMSFNGVTQFSFPTPTALGRWMGLEVVSGGTVRSILSTGPVA